MAENFSVFRGSVQNETFNNGSVSFNVSYLPVGFVLFSDVSGSPFALFHDVYDCGDLIFFGDKVFDVSNSVLFQAVRQFINQRYYGDFSDVFISPMEVRDGSRIEEFLSDEDDELF